MTDSRLHALILALALAAAALTGAPGSLWQADEARAEPPTRPSPTFPPPEPPLPIDDGIASGLCCNDI